MDHIDQLLVRQIHSVMVSFVKICAHVVKYRQSRKRDRFLQHAKSILTEDSDLDNEMKTFRAQLQKQRDVEGTVTLAMLFETHQDVAQLLEQSASLNRTTEKTQKDVQSLKEDADRVDTLVRIRDTVGTFPNFFWEGFANSLSSARRPIHSPTRYQNNTNMLRLLRQVLPGERRVDLDAQGIY